MLSAAGATSRVRAVVDGPLPTGRSFPVLKAVPGDAAPSAAGFFIGSVSGVWRPEAPRAAPGPVRSTIRAGGSAAAGTARAEVDRWVVRFSRGGAPEMRRALGRMTRYEPLIRQSLREQGLPQDLLFLALIESSFLPAATSSAGAAGIWQLMPETARLYGLEVSEYVDERRDPLRSTAAAVRHLDWLHTRFGSWHLAAAAYNAGEGRVEGVRERLAPGKRRGETQFWLIRPGLPTETQHYVPKMLAARQIGRSPLLYGVEAARPAVPLAFREVNVRGGTPLATVAATLRVAPEVLYELNPHLIRKATPPGRPWRVRIPPNG